MLLEEDALYVKRVLNGDPDAYEYLVRKYMNSVYFFLYKRVGKQEDAKDLTQECFIRAYNYLASYDPSKKFSTWLYRMAINLSHNEQGKQQRQKEMIHTNQLFIDQRSPEQVIIHKETHFTYKKELNHLPEHYRSAIYLRYVEEMSYQEISELMNLSIQEVRNILYRARKKLRQQLAAQVKGEMCT